MKIEKYSFGMGDRFAHQGRAQLQAIVNAKSAGVDIAPVWNKSHREHEIVGTDPQSLRDEADAAVKALGWQGAYYVDADHITLKTVDRFLHCSDFFTLDVGDDIGERAAGADIDAFCERHARFVGTLDIPGSGAYEVTRATLESAAATYLKAVQTAGRVYRHIVERRGPDFVPEVSMDETKNPQTPLEMFFILAMIADEGIPAQTVAPKFTGRFNKGVDYVGRVAQFEKEFNDDLAAIALAVREFGLPDNLKLSIHSGSDKFSIYGPIARALKRSGAGIHVKTAGTTWLEELIGLAEGGGEGLAIAKEIYAKALEKIDALCAPYATVIDIDHSRLPSADEVAGWSSERYADALRHVQSNPHYNLHLRQLLHVGYKVAAQMGERYYAALRRYEIDVARNVTENLWERHIRPLFLD